MKLFRGKGGFLAGLMLLFSQAAMADDGRTDLGGPGEAEVIAGTGYQHTLFDSADNKCQHCHNDLYDTWKTSMHAKSWQDPIFQSKYQDFLRLQVSKIGATGPTGEYKEGTIQKTGQVCIKCHAPTAYYSGDYKIELTAVGDMNVDPMAWSDGLALEDNLAPAYDPEASATVASMSKQGKVYTVSYHIGHKHNREGINCAFCHSIETVRMMRDDVNFGDGGQYTLKGPLKQGPIGPIVRNPGDTLHYDDSAAAPDMNAFFALIGPEKYIDTGVTPKGVADFDNNKAADGRYTMKGIPTGVDADSGKAYYTGGPFYGPFGVTGLSNSRDDDASDRAALVNAHFQHAVEAADGDKFTSEHHFGAYGKSLCLGCHQRSSLMLNPESNEVAGVQPKEVDGVPADQFLELCSTWTAFSDGVDAPSEDTRSGPKCQRCHMEPLANKTVLHKWDSPNELFTAADGVTEHFDPESGVGPVAEGYLNNHAFMGANKADFGLVKIKSGFEADMKVKFRRGDDDDDDDDDDNNRRKLVVKTSLLNKTGHMFPGAHPMRRVLTRVVVTDANGDKVPFVKATGRTKFRSITNQVAVLDGNSIVPGFDEVKVKYNEDRNIVIQGQTPHLDEDGEAVVSQMMDTSSVDWVSPDATVGNCTLEDGTVVPKGPVTADGNTWSIKGCTTVKKIIDTDVTGHFTRVYGRETGKYAPDGTHVVRPGFDSNIAADNRLEPNEKEKYRIKYDTRNVTAWPLSVTYKVYYLKKGGSGKFPTGADGFLDTSLPAATLKKLAIYEVYSQTETVTGP